MSKPEDIPDDMWKLAEIVTMEHDGEEIRVKFHVPPMIAFHALVLRKELSIMGKEQETLGTVIVPSDVSDESRLMMASACVAAIVAMGRGVDEFKQPTIVGLN